jgi:small subunit ribosomal protein S6
MLKQYETTFIIDAHLPVDQIDIVIEKITGFVEKSNGEVISIDRWGKRRLAYGIAKKQYGYYVYVRFGAEGSFVRKLEKEFKLNTRILRHLIVLVPTVILKEEAKTKKKLDDIEQDQVEVATPAPASDVEVVTPAPASDVEVATPEPASDVEVATPAPASDVEVATPAPASDVEVATPEPASDKMDLFSDEVTETEEKPEEKSEENPEEKLEGKPEEKSEEKSEEKTEGKPEEDPEK